MGIIWKKSHMRILSAWALPLLPVYISLYKIAHNPGHKKAQKRFRRIRAIENLTQKQPLFPYTPSHN